MATQGPKITASTDNPFPGRPTDLFCYPAWVGKTSRIKAEPNHISALGNAKGESVDELVFPRGVAGLPARIGLGVGKATGDHITIVGDNLPIPSVVTAGHNAEYNTALHLVIGAIHDAPAESRVLNQFTGRVPFD
jgi:hypothetical protein